METIVTLILYLGIGALGLAVVLLWALVAVLALAVAAGAR